MTQDKAFEIPKTLVWKSYLDVRKNRGASGIDGQTLKQFDEKSLQDLEPSMLGLLFPAAGSGKENTERRWQRAGVGHSYGIGPDRARSSQAVHGGKARSLVMQAEGQSELKKRDIGTPQGGVISPLLANLFLHDAFDRWMERPYRHRPFERYADDIVCHCSTMKEAVHLKEELQKRFQPVGLDH